MYVEVEFISVFTKSKYEIISHDHTPHLEYCNSLYQTTVAKFYAH